MPDLVAAYGSRISFIYNDLRRKRRIEKAVCATPY
jgi:hypothetical protein